MKYIKTLNPMQLSITGIVISFIIFIIGFSILKPCYIKTISDEGIEYISNYLLFGYSLLFSLITGLIIFLTKINCTNNMSSIKLVNPIKLESKQELNFSPN